MMGHLQMPVSLAGESVQTIAPGGVEPDIRAVKPVSFRTGY